MTKPIEYVNIHGQPVDWTSLSAANVKPPKEHKEPPAQYHKGWRVEGHPKGELERDRDLALAASKQWRERSDERIAEDSRDGKRPPPVWDEQVWRQSAPFKAIRARKEAGFNNPESANAARQIAERDGWTDVRVVEVSKGKKPKDGTL